MRFAVCMPLLLAILRAVFAIPIIPAVELQPSSSWITYGSTETDSQTSPDFAVHDHVSSQIKRGHFNLATTQHTAVLPDALPTAMRTTDKLSNFRITLVDKPKSVNVEPAIRLATSIVEHTWKSEVPVNMRIAFAELGGSNVLANGGGTHFARMRKIFQEIVPIAAAESFLGRDLNAREPGNGHFDVLITVNTNTHWYLGTDGNTPRDQYDLATVLLHEIYHNLVFTGGIFVEVTEDEKGHVFEEAKIQHDLITRFDAFLATKEGCAILGYLSDEKLQKRTGRKGTQLLAQAVVNDSLYFGYHAFGVMVQLHAPRVFKAKSSIYHIDPRTSNADAMMSPVIRPGSSQHQIGPVILKMQSLFLNPDVKGANPNCPRPLADPKPSRKVTPEERSGAYRNGEPVHDAPTSLDSMFIEVNPNRISPAVIITLSVLGGLLLLALLITLALIAMGACTPKPPPPQGEPYYDSEGKEPTTEITRPKSVHPSMPPMREFSSKAPSSQQQSYLRPPPPVCMPPSSRHPHPKAPSKHPSSSRHSVPRHPSKPPSTRHSYPKERSCKPSSRECHSHRQCHRPSRAPKTHDYFDCS